MEEYNSNSTDAASKHDSQPESDSISSTTFWDVSELVKATAEATKPVDLHGAMLSLTKMSSSLLEYERPSIVQPMIDGIHEIADTLRKINFTKVLENAIAVGDAVKSIQYIRFLREVKWPLFLVVDESFRQKVTSLEQQNYVRENITKLVEELFEHGYLDEISKRWASCTSICCQRKDVLDEAIVMHKAEHYYASTSILMCQIYGIASDIACLVESKGLSVSEQAKQMIAKRYGLELQYIDSEKGRLLQTISLTNSGVILWDAMAEYLKNEILSSSESKARWASQPLRNKICHGTQLNFGTVEHSLKAILTIDMLIQLSIEIDSIEINTELVAENE